MKARFNGRSFVFPSDYLAELRDSADLIGDPNALKARMVEDGYLLMRAFIDRQAVLTARRAVLTAMAEEHCLLPGTDLMDGIIDPAGKGSHAADSRLPQIGALFGDQPFLSFFTGYFGEPAMMYPKILTRVKARGGRTGIHYDNVYVGRGSDRVLSCWTPFGDIDVEQGTLAICVGSHDLPGFEQLRRTYGRHDPDRDRIKGAENAPGHFSFDLPDVTDSFGGQWHTTNFRAGDVLIFPALTLHCALDNTTNRYRLSTDTRFQPAADPVDDRFMVNMEPEGTLRHRRQVAEGTISAITMEEARARWKLR